MRIVKVTEYDANWVQQFEEEAKRLKEVFNDELVKIHHFGSTSVPGLKAKPIIDIMPLVRNIEMVELFNESMGVIGYESLGEFGIKGRRYFRKGGDDRTHHVHIFQFDNAEEIDRTLAVRDYLRVHPEDAKKYGDLKEKLAKQFPHDIEAYMDGKDEFVKSLERRALQWYKNKI